MKTMKVIFLTLLSVLAASAQVLKFGKCPKPAVQANFDATRVNTTLFSYFHLLLINRKVEHVICTILLKLNQFRLRQRLPSFLSV